MDQNEYEEPTESDKELTSFVIDHCDRWRDWRDTNYLQKYLEFERIYRGEWAAEDKTRDSERSRIVTPATQQAVETRHAEIMEAIFGQGEFFDIEDDLQDVDGNPMDVEMLKKQLMEDFKLDKIRKAIDQIELMAEIYGTGIGEIVVKTEKIFEPSTRAIPGQMGQAAIGVVEKNRTAVKIVPVNPKNFLFDPNGTRLTTAWALPSRSMWASTRSSRAWRRASTARWRSELTRKTAIWRQRKKSLNIRTKKCVC